MSDRARGLTAAAVASLRRGGPGEDRRDDLILDARRVVERLVRDERGPAAAVARRDRRLLAGRIDIRDVRLVDRLAVPALVRLEVVEQRRALRDLGRRAVVERGRAVDEHAEHAAGVTVL